MKPTKNRHYCKDCGRHKMLFETEKKANTFIKFNSEEIEEETGKKIIRSYFCEYCGGWHITSQRDHTDIKSKTEKIVEIYEENKKKYLEYRQQEKEKEKIKSEKQKDILRQALNTLEEHIIIIEKSNKDIKNYPEMIDEVDKEFREVTKYKIDFKGSVKIKKELKERIAVLKKI